MEQEVLRTKQMCSIILTRVEETNNIKNFKDATIKYPIIEIEDDIQTNPAKNLPPMTKTIFTCDNEDLLNKSNQKNFNNLQKDDDPEHKGHEKKERAVKLKLEDYSQSQAERHTRSGINGNSNTSLSREFSALRKSVNDSKVLTEFFTDSDIKLHDVNGLSEEAHMMTTHKSLQQQKKRKHRKNISTQINPHETAFEQQSYPCRSRAKCSLIKHTNISFNCFHTQTSNRSHPEQITLKSMKRRTNLRSNNSDVGQYEDDDIQCSNSFCITENQSAVCDINNKDTVSMIKKRSLNLFYNFKCNSDENCINCQECLEKRLETIWQPPPQPGWDPFCWKCHEAGNLIPCAKCIRSFHLKCLKMSKFDAKMNTGIWICPECTIIDNVINSSKRNRRSDLRLELLNQLLSFVLKRMQNMRKDLLGIYDTLTNFEKYIVNPVTFETLNQKIANKDFRCGEEFVNESKWILHNVAIIVGRSMDGLKQISIAKSILKCCRQETNEIYICPECYLNANTRSDWFVEVCTQPHLLVWAKLKGFPYWPAKVMGTGQGNFVNVRFFGEHDRAYVPVKDCYLFSEENPNTQTSKRSFRELTDCMQEVYTHIENVKAKIGNFCFAPFKTPYEPLKEMKQLEKMMPGVNDYMNRNFSVLTIKPSLQYKIVKTADNNLSIIKKTGDELNENEEVAKAKCVLATKYEVISKVNNNKNYEKVNTVILKRKSVDSCHKEGVVETNLYEEQASKGKLRKMSEQENETTSTVVEKNINKDDKNSQELQNKLKSQNVEAQTRIENSTAAEIDKTNAKEQKIDIKKSNETCLPTIHAAPVPFVEIKDEFSSKDDEETHNRSEAGIEENQTYFVQSKEAPQKLLHKPIAIKKEINFESEYTAATIVHQRETAEDCHQSELYNCDKNVHILNKPYKNNIETNKNDSRDMQYFPKSILNNTKKFAQTKKTELARSTLLKAGTAFKCKSHITTIAHTLSRNNQNNKLHSSMVSIPADNIKPQLCEENAIIPYTAELLMSVSNKSTINAASSTDTNTTLPTPTPIQCQETHNTIKEVPQKSAAASTTSTTCNINNSKPEEFINSMPQILPHLSPRPSTSFLSKDNATPIGTHVGPIYRTMAKNARKLTDFFMTVMESTLNEISPGDNVANLQATIALLQMQLERVKSTYEEKIATIKHNADLMISEMQQNMEAEKIKIADEIRRQCELERQRAIEETKKKQWCANCGIESQFYCCWNTSYCDYPCQQLHWSRHAAYCAQARKLVQDTNSISDPRNHNKELGTNNVSTVALYSNNWDSTNDSSLVNNTLKSSNNTSLCTVVHPTSSNQRISTAVQTISTNYTSSSGYYINSITPTSSTASMECDLSDFNHN